MAGLTRISESITMTGAKVLAAMNPRYARKQSQTAETTRPNCTANIFGYTDCIDGKIYIKGTNDCIGWYNAEKAIGWCDANGYKRLLAFIQSYEAAPDWSEGEEV